MAARPPAFSAAVPGTSIALSQPPAPADGTPATAGPAPASSTQPNPATATAVTTGIETRLTSPTSTAAAAHEAGPARQAPSPILAPPGGPRHNAGVLTASDT